MLLAQYKMIFSIANFISLPLIECNFLQKKMQARHVDFLEQNYIYATAPKISNID